LKKGFVPESVLGVQNIPSSRIELTSNPNAPSAGYNRDLNYFHGILIALSLVPEYKIPDAAWHKKFIDALNDLKKCHPEKFNELFIQYPSQVWKKAGVSDKVVQSLFSEIQNKLVDETVTERITGDKTLSEKHKMYHAEYFEGIEAKIEKRQREIETVHAPGAITAIQRTAQENIDVLLKELNILLKKDGTSLQTDTNQAQLDMNAILKVGEESLLCKYDSNAIPRLTEYEYGDPRFSEVYNNQYSALAEKITDNQKMQSIFLQHRAFKEVQDACAPQPSAPELTSTDDEPGAKVQTTMNTQHLISILKAVNDATEKMKSTAQVNIKYFNEDKQRLHWVQWVATLSVIGIPVAMLHSKIKHGTVFYGSHQEKHAARKQSAANQAFALFNEKTKSSVDQAKHIPVIEHGANKRNVK